MNRLWILACTALSLSRAVVPAQESKQQGGQPEPRQEQPVDAQKDKALRAWIQQLGSTEFKERQEAHDKLLGAGHAALPLLEAASKDSDDPEIRWQARKLTREINRGKPARPEVLRKVAPDDQAEPRPRALPQPLGSNGLDDRFEDLFQQLEHEFGVRVPRGQFFGNDFFKDLERQMGDLGNRGFGQFQGQGQGFTMQIAPDKVRIEIKQKDADGKADNQVYEAPDLKTFREKYPEIARKYLQGVDGQGGMAFRLGPPLQRMWGAPDPGVRVKARKGGVRVLEPDTGGADADDAPPPAEEIPAGERLGVHIKADLSPDLREFLGLDENQGLQVVEVLDDNLGAALGVRKGDILAEINGARIVGPEVIRATLKGVAAGGDVRLLVFRKGEKLELKGHKGAAAK